MVYKKFRLQIIIRIFVLLATIFFLFFALYDRYHFALVIAIALLVFQTISLFRYVDRTNRDLSNFLESIRHAEFSSSFKSEKLGSSFDQLSEAFNRVIKDFQKVRSEKEEHFHYLQSIVQNIEISIIAYLPDGTVELINKSAKKLFQVSALKNIKSLEKFGSDLVKTLLEIRPGQNYLVKVQGEDDILQLAINATELKIKDKLIIIASISNIQNVLDEQETEAWQKLIRVLTHEIMNSITPIASLSSTIEGMLENTDPQKHPAKTSDSVSENAGEIQKALQTINKRSTGLLHFVNTYRNLTRIPKPNFKITRVSELINNIKILTDEELRKNNIKLVTIIEPDNLEVFADEQLVEQVIINLVKNSVNALENVPNASICIKALYNKRGRVVIQVVDNGKGILKDVIDKIFIPFFTTKPNGSGIGLSLSKQILRLHNGSISVYSEPEKNTVFTLTF
jgi:two-component system, NtrC family, nitrogen regulation sensor histidine kinase NtrY